MDAALTKLTETDVGDFVTRADLLQLVYPVGSIYISAGNVSPQTFLGGTCSPWRMFFCWPPAVCIPPAAPGAKPAHTLSQEEMPRHFHLTMAPNKNNTNNQTTTYGGVLPTIEWQSSEGVGVASDFLANTDNVPSDCYTGGSKATTTCRPIWRFTCGGGRPDVRGK